jgi:hypothetical protein
MAGDRYTPAVYALQRIVKSFGSLLYDLAEHHLSQTYLVFYRFCELENIDYLVVRYLDTAMLPFKEFSEKSLYNWET